MKQQIQKSDNKVDQKNLLDVDVAMQYHNKDQGREDKHDLEETGELRPVQKMTMQEAAVPLERTDHKDY